MSLFHHFKSYLENSFLPKRLVYGKEVKKGPEKETEKIDEKKTEGRGKIQKKLQEMIKKIESLRKEETEEKNKTKLDKFKDYLEGKLNYLGKEYKKLEKKVVEELKKILDKGVVKSLEELVPEFGSAKKKIEETILGKESEKIKPADIPKTSEHVLEVSKMILKDLKDKKISDEKEIKEPAIRTLSLMLLVSKEPTEWLKDEELVNLLLPPKYKGKKKEFIEDYKKIFENNKAISGPFGKLGKQVITVTSLP